MLRILTKIPPEETSFHGIIKTGKRKINFVRFVLTEKFLDVIKILSLRQKGKKTRNLYTQTFQFNLFIY